MRIAALMLILLLLPTQIGAAREGGFDCGRSFCGCWTDVLITYEATIFNTNHIPQTDIQVFCLNQLNTFLGTTDSFGKIKMNITTSVSPGCGLGCDVLKLVKDTSTTFDAWSSKIEYSKLKTYSMIKKPISLTMLSFLTVLIKKVTEEMAYMRAFGKNGVQVGSGVSAATSGYRVLIKKG